MGLVYDAKVEADKPKTTAWWWMGFVFVWTGLIIAYLHQPHLPKRVLHECTGMKASEAMLYRTAYRDHLRQRRIKRTWPGVWAAVPVIILLGIVYMMPA